MSRPGLGIRSYYRGEIVIEAYCQVVDSSRSTRACNACSAAEREAIWASIRASIWARRWAAEGSSAMLDVGLWRGGGRSGVAPGRWGGGASRVAGCRGRSAVRVAGAVGVLQ